MARAGDSSFSLPHPSGALNSICIAQKTGDPRLRLERYLSEVVGTYTVSVDLQLIMGPHLVLVHKDWLG